MKAHWSLNLFGIALFILMTGWLLFASTARLLEEITTGTVEWRPVLSLALGLLGMVGMGWGRVYWHDTDREGGGWDDDRG